jgi:hypothetical protein
MANILLIIIVAAVALILLAIRTNALYVFFGLCAGNALVQFASKNMAYVNGHLNTNLLPHGYTVSQPSILLAILLLPPVLVAVLAKHDNGPTKWPIQIFPAIATGILGVLFVVPLLSSSMQQSITQNKFWNLLEQYQVPVVGVCVIACLVLLILKTYSRGSHHGHHKSKSHHTI